MKKDVLIKISGVQTGGINGSDKTEIVTRGSYYKKNNKHYLFYDEITEGSSEVTKNSARFDGKIFRISKSGFINADMLFEENKRNKTDYTTPYGSLVMDIDTSSIRIEEKEDNINIDIAYSLHMDNEHFADCMLHMDVLSPDS